MFVSMFKVVVDSVDVNDLSTTLRLKDSEGNTITLFFDEPMDVREFSRDIRHATIEAVNKEWDTFDRPNLITDKQDGGIK